MRYSRILGLMLASLVLTTGLGGCGQQFPGAAAGQTVKKTESGGTKVESSQTKDPIVTIEMENGGIIKIELYPKTAPNTVKNFISLVQKGFYDGLIFHRVIPGFMIQGGDPKGNGMGGPGYSIKGEFAANGFDNPLKHTRGVISMARSNNPNSAGSQFFIMVGDAPYLDGQYAAFGKVIEGMNVVDQIANVPRDGSDKPLQPQTMKTVTVDTFGVNYGPPEIIK
ncbi:Peptidylprolyl isomerase [Acididesulfobacillus acetoxydans]|uniref:Peptidyl-prolyl cis-trans isomerase n=2 Tax=Acididesulfobacillus acetoxydans TaxID=1561005 RepID=A0A8S0X3Q0_9FIRM|nr:Peptidylprolyl isomerase [Acididesulfobacillus acetoxydans]CEJ06066.1 Peptidyl-prolyl cis-trans isomerase [Acididesulfobacillus acetoxydans]